MSQTSAHGLLLMLQSAFSSEILIYMLFFFFTFFVQIDILWLELSVHEIWLHLDDQGFFFRPQNAFFYFMITVKLWRLFSN